MLSSLLKRLHQWYNGAPTRDLLDRSLGWTGAERFAQYLNKNDFDAFEREYAALSWVERSLLVDFCCIDAHLEPHIDNWTQTNRSSPTAHLFKGVYLTEQAWRARPQKTARQISPEAQKNFANALNQALEHLQYAYDIQQNDPEIGARIIRVMTGLGTDEDTVERMFIAVKQLEPNHLHAHLAMLHYLTPKWHGNNSLAYGFANTQYTQSDQGILSVLPLYAMVEEWLFLAISGDKAAHDAFFSTGNQRNYILKVQGKFVEMPETALLTPIFYNYAAFLLLNIGEPALVQSIAPKFVKGKMTEYPWAYIDVNTHTELEKVLHL